MNSEEKNALAQVLWDYHKLCLQYPRKAAETIDNLAEILAPILDASAVVDLAGQLSKAESEAKAS